MTTLLRCAELCHAAYGGTAVGNHSFWYMDDGGVRIIAIAGTKNLENVLEDVSVWPRFTPTRSLAHAGVVNGFKDLEESVGRIVPEKGGVLFTGHSLGGGIAQMFAEKYDCGVITFGSLKTYLRFYPAPNLNHRRVVCDDDPVPLVPGICYAHRCDAIVLHDRDNELLNVKDHFITEYIRRLKRLAI